MIKTAAALATVLVLIAACFVAGCDGATEEHTLTREELMKPETCKECHPKHYREWASSMHAYATKDPVFVAMNKRGQREANLGTFCVNCHAPMAVREGATKDGLNLDSVPEHLQGVTCYFCHNAISAPGNNNNMVRLANDTTMRGPITDPVNPKVHHAEYSELQDRYKAQSSQMCGGCHDIVTPNHGVHLERTFAEYKDSLLSKENSVGFLSCQNCHMRESMGTAAENVKGLNLKSRPIHDHLWPAVDVPLTDFPNREALRSAVEDCELPGTSIDYSDLLLDDSKGPGNYKLTLETGAGHAQPSGAAHDRRMWLELTAYGSDGKVAYESGNIADDAPEVAPADHTDFYTFQDHIYGANGKPVHMFWDAAKSDDHMNGYENGDALPVIKTAVAGSHSRTVAYSLGGIIPSKVEVRLRMRPIGRDVLQDLVDSKDLDPAILDEMPTFTAFSARFDFEPTDPNASDPVTTSIADCKRYKCLYDPKSDACETD